MSKRLKSQKGTQLVEMAVVLPFLVLVMMGATDFARVSYTSITLAHAARTGAQYGVQSFTHAKNTAGIQNAACADADDLDPSTACVISVTSDRYCQCPGSGAVVSCSATTACSGSAPKEVYVRVTANRTFSTMVPYPGMPSAVPLTREAVLRVQ